MVTPPAPNDPNREIQRMDYEASIKEASDRLRFQQEIGLAAVRSTLLVNGGAVVALLTFIGNTQGRFDDADLRRAFTFFCVGVVASLLSMWTAYIGQEWLSNMRTSIAWNYQENMRGKPPAHDFEKERKSGWILMAISSAFVLTGVVTFIAGAFAALGGIL